MVYVEEKEKPALRQLVDVLEGEVTAFPIGKDQSIHGRDAGAFAGAIFQAGARGYFTFRPAKVTGAEPSAKAILGATFSAYGRYEAWAAVALLRSAGLRAIAERIATSTLPKGGYEANPLLSAPDLVVEVAKAKKLSSQAACHYLQLLGLLEPTSKSIQLWNGWKPVDYKKTVAELIERKLVVSGKRERAGREIFLPGAWTKPLKPKDLPTEEWKRRLYTIPDGALLRTLPPRPLPEIFAAAWKRIVANDVPKLEEV